MFKEPDDRRRNVTKNLLRDPLGVTKRRDRRRMARGRGAIAQAAALPVKDGRVCLVMSGGGRWILPKGHVEAAETANQAASREAWEEAGLNGSVAEEPVGSYEYEKSGRTYAVTVFLMQVSSVSNDWPESNRRLRRWLDPTQARELPSLPPLRKLLQRVLTEELVQSDGR